MQKTLEKKIQKAVKTKAVVELDLYPGYAEDMDYFLGILKTDAAQWYPQYNIGLVQKIMLDIHLSKQELAEKLGMGPDFRLTLPLVDTEAAEASYKGYLQSVLDQAKERTFTVSWGNVTGNSFLDTHGRTVRLRKHLNTILTEEMYQAALKRWVYWGSMKNWIPDNLSRFLDIIFEQAAGQRPDKHLIISLNPIDQLLCTTNVGFSSCFSIKGGSSSPMAITRSATSGIAFILDSKEKAPQGKKIGRKWLFFGGEGQSVISGRNYNFTDSQHQAMMSELTKRLAPEGNWRDFKARVYSVMYMDAAGPAKTLLPLTIQPADWNAEKPICFACGADNTHARNLCRDTCNGKILTCVDCKVALTLGTESYEPPRYTDKPRCKACYDKIYSDCSICCYSKPIADLQNIKGNGSMCPTCVRDYFVDCDACGGEKKNINHMTRTCDGNFLCKQCTPKHTCGSCRRSYFGLCMETMRCQNCINKEEARTARLVPPDHWPVPVAPVPVAVPVEEAVVFTLAPDLKGIPEQMQRYIMHDEGFDPEEYCEEDEE